MAKYLALWLEGPLQSWGIDSKFYNRSTETFPSRSAIVGIILSAMGKGGEQKELLSYFKNLSQTIISYNHMKNKKPVRLRDFHMVGSGYNTKDKWQNLMIPKKSDGTSAVGGGSKLTYRYYLQDMAFGVIFELPKDDELREKIVTSIQSPIWDTFLGRKNCVPTEFLYQGVFDNLEDIETQFKELSNKKNYIESFRVFDKEVENSEKVNVNDVPVDFGIHKKYELRSIYIVRT